MVRDDTSTQCAVEEIDMNTSSQALTRKVGRVENKIHFGADAQVDDRNVIIVPNQPLRTDPFLLLSEDWFSSPGFEWHHTAASKRSPWCSTAFWNTATTSATTAPSTSATCSG
jgi:hypothetical protein